jgi:two-component system OmpR family response regulator
MLGPSTGTRRRPRILVVDDDSSLLTLLRILLLDSGFEVHTAINGIDALRQAESNTFDLLVLDLDMPGMDGRQFFHEYRSRGYDGSILILSAYGAEAGRRELGADAAVSKPFEPERLTNVVEQLLGARP